MRHARASKGPTFPQTKAPVTWTHLPSATARSCRRWRQIKQHTAPPMAGFAAGGLATVLVVGEPSSARQVPSRASLCDSRTKAPLVTPVVELGAGARRWFRHSSARDASTCLCLWERRETSAPGGAERRRLCSAKSHQSPPPTACEREGSFLSKQYNNYFSECWQFGQYHVLCKCRPREREKRARAGAPLPPARGGARRARGVWCTPGAGSDGL